MGACIRGCMRPCCVRVCAVSMFAEQINIFLLERSYPLIASCSLDSCSQHVRPVCQQIQRFSINKVGRCQGTTNLSNLLTQHTTLLAISLRFQNALTILQRFVNFDLIGLGTIGEKGIGLDKTRTRAHERTLACCLSLPPSQTHTPDNL